jgi:hypothetical protein
MPAVHRLSRLRAIPPCGTSAFTETSPQWGTHTFMNTTNRDDASVPEFRYPWRLHEAAAIAAGLRFDCQRSGWLLAIYGSVLSGGGRDLDLMAVPWRPNPCPPHMMLEMMARALNAERLGDIYTGLMGTRSQLLRMNNGLLIDIQFHLCSLHCGDVSEGAPVPHCPSS